MRWVTEFVYRVNSAWVHVLVFLATKRDIRGKENVPKSGPVIIVSNHLNNADPPVLDYAVRRNISWLTKAEWFKIKRPS